MMGVLFVTVAVVIVLAYAESNRRFASELRRRARINRLYAEGLHERMRLRRESLATDSLATETARLVVAMAFGFASLGVLARLSTFVRDFRDYR